MSHLEAALLAYLLNSLWQLPLLFTAAWLAARLARRTSLTLEHRIWTSALILEAVIPACPAHALPVAWNFLAHLWRHTVAPATTQITVTATVAYTHSRLHLPASLRTAIASLYVGALFYATSRLLYSLVKTHQLRRTAHAITLHAESLQGWQRCASIFRVPNAHIATSTRIAVPSTIGIRHCLVLLPANLPPILRQDDFDAALAHEFAHMQRRDFAFNLLYRLLSLPIAWHPLLWLTSTRIAETREMLCDTLAAQSLAGPDRQARYARSLLRLASLLLHGALTPTPHAIGIFDANIFERRLMHLTTHPLELRATRRLATAALCLLLGLGTCTSALALHIAVPTPSPLAAPQQPSDAPAAARISGGVIAGNRLSYVNPVYPPDAKAAQLSGIVVLHALIGKDGAIEKLTVLSGPEIFQQSALDAVRQWVYKPYLLNGEPTEVDTTITVNYSIAK